MSVSREQEDVDRDVTALSTGEVDTSMEVSAVDSEIIEPEFDPVEVAERDFSRWLAEIATGTETDTMLRYAPTKSNSIDITHSQPSGLTQFLLARRTRLTTLLRDQIVMKRSIVTAEAHAAHIPEPDAVTGRK